MGVMSMYCSAVNSFQKFYQNYWGLLNTRVSYSRENRVIGEHIVLLAKKIFTL